MPLIALREQARVIQRPWSGRPRHPFAVNRDSEQFQGLVAWWPCMPFVDLIDMGPNGRFRLARNGPVWVADAEMGAVPEFASASSQYFEIPLPVLTGTPISMTCWFFTTDDTGGDGLIEIGTAGSFDNAWRLSSAGDIAGDPVIAVARTTATSIAQTTIGFSLSTWHHGSAVFASSTSRAAYIDGGNKGTNTVSRIPSGVNTTAVGRSVNNVFYMDGRIADARIYNRALTDAEVYRQWHPNTRWELYYPLGRKTYMFFPSAAIEVCGPTYGLTDEAAVSLILHRRHDDTAETSDLLTKVLHAVKDDTQEISDSVLTEIAGAVVVLLTVNDALEVMDEFIRHQHAQQGDDAGFQEAVAKALHKITDDGVLDVTDETVSAVIRYLLAQDTEDAADLILKVVHAIRDEDAAISDEFTRQQQAGHEDTQAQEDAFTKVLHAIKSDDQHVSDEALAILVKILLAQDTTEMNDLITKALHALKADDAIVADEFTRHQQAGVTDDQAAQDAFVKVLHTLKTEDQAASDEALLAAIKYLLASEEIDLEDFITKILHAVKAEDQAASDVFEKQQRAVLEDSQQAEDTVVKILAKIAEDDQALTDLIVGTLHKLLGDDMSLPDDFVKRLTKVVEDSQEITDEITAAIVARLVQLLLDDTAEASDETLKQLRKTVAENQSILDDIVTQITGLTLLVIDEALQAADEVLKAIHNVTDETGYIISDQAALQRVVEAVISERQEAADEFLKVASMVFGDEHAAAEALVKAVMKVLADGPVDFTETVTAEIVEEIIVGFIQTMLSGVSDPQHKTSGIGREPRLTAGVNDPQGKESGISRSPRLTSAIRDLMQIISDIKGTRK